MRTSRESQRVAITAVGVVSVGGRGVDALWDHVSDPDADPGDGTVPGEVEASIPRRRRRRMSRFSQLAQVAGLDAAGSARAERGGVVIGTAYGGIDDLMEQFVLYQQDGPRAVSPTIGVMFPVNAPGAELTATLGWTGPSTGVSTACASGTQALIDGARLIADGTCDVVLAGGVEQLFGPPLVHAFERLAVIAPSGRCRPFDRARDGFVPAEGAAVFRLESSTAVEQRGGTVLAEIAGWASATDPGAGWSPDDEHALIACMSQALAHADVDPGAVGHINAHGTGTPTNDRIEAAAISAVFGSAVPVVSVKGAIGHVGGGAGALELAVAVETIRRGVVPPTAGLLNLDDGIDVAVSSSPAPVAPAPALSNSIGLGGHLASIVVTPHQ